VNGHLEGSQTQGGDPNAEAGVAVGGPLIDGVLAGHASVWYRHDGGYVDHVSAYTGATLPGGDHTNSEDHRAFHVALAWNPTDSLLISASYYFINNVYRDSDNYWASIPQYQNYLGPGTPGTLETYCPCNFGAFKVGLNTNVGKNFYTSDSQLSPLLASHGNSLSLPSLTIDYAFPGVDLKLISGYSRQIADQNPNYSWVDTASRASTPLEAPYNTLPGNGPFIATLPVYSAVFPSWATDNNYTEELRLTSTNPDARVTWVGGLFYQLTKENTLAEITSNVGDLAAAARLGLPSAAGTPFAALNGVGYVDAENLRETQEAVYGQLNWKIIEPLHLLAGLRLTRDSFSFHQQTGGTLFGYPPGVLKTTANGSITQNPVTPLVGLQYFVNPGLNFYATAAKGFRPGGVNGAVAPSCAANLKAVGYPNGAPSTYSSDSLWSYEFGAKAVTWGGRASLDGSLFYIDWPGVQTQIRLACGNNITVNAAKAVSKGADLQAAFVLFPGFTARLSGAYTKATYQGTVSTGAALPLILSGDRVPYTSEWSGTASLQYQFHVADRPSFARIDYTYHGNQVQPGGYGPGTAGFLPDAYYLGPTRIGNARAGMEFGKFAVQAFVTNLFNSQDTLVKNGFAVGPGPVGCKNASCTQYSLNAEGAILTTFKPRTYGLDVNYKY
jgi:iron complex outermembrane receptor protein